ncbi:hypothetical protein CDAR_118361 [Caerostris darwini]|uniref:Uncharacterized protein n=1 Tax=Caerostris darwini TaxID=1538125 RepID=A0AAV4UAL1_9ARAC|nr:hypothetical protein CDAR_118361 [Caerostris darwini]
MFLNRKYIWRKKAGSRKTTHPKFCWALENRNLASAYHAYQTSGRFYSGDDVTQGYVLNQKSDVSGTCPTPFKYSGSNRKIFLLFIIRIQKSVPCKEIGELGKGKKLEEKLECGAINADRRGFHLEKKCRAKRRTCIKTTHPEFCWALENRNLASADHACRTPGRFYSADVVTQGYVLNQRSDVSGICPAPLKYSGSHRKIFSLFHHSNSEICSMQRNRRIGEGKKLEEKVECGAINADR